MNFEKKNCFLDLHKQKYKGHHRRPLAVGVLVIIYDICFTCDTIAQGGYHSTSNNQCFTKYSV